MQSADYLKLVPQDTFDLSKTLKTAGQGFDLGAGIQKQNTLADVGLAASQGDMPGATAAAFKGGQPELGLKLSAEQRTQLEHETKSLGQFVSETEGLTPEQYQVTVNQRRQSGMQLGPEWDGEQGQSLALARGKNMLETAKRHLTEAQAEFYGTKGQVMTQNADTRRIKAYGDIIQRYGEDPSKIDPQMWEQDNQPGGFIQTTFGRPIPFEQRDRIIQMAQARARGGPNEQELLDMGINANAVKDLQRQNAITKSVGKAPEKGHVWDFNDKGELFQRAVKEKDDKGSIPLTQLQFNLENLRRSFDVITGGTNPETGKLAGKGPWLPTRAIANTAAGGYVTPQLTEAYQAADHAAMTLSYALSGKQVGQREQATIRQFFVPSAADKDEIAAFKLNAAHSLFQRLIEAKKAGATDQAREELFDSALVTAARRIREMQGGAAPQQSQDRPPAGRAPAADGWSIKRLDKPSGIMRLGGPTEAEQPQQPQQAPAQNASDTAPSSDEIMSVARDAGYQGNSPEEAMQAIWEKAPSDQVGDALERFSQRAGLRPPWHADFKQGRR